MRKCICPNCNANLTFSDDRDVAFCQYCGAKIMLDDYRSTRRIINDAKVKEAETEQFKAETDRILKMQKIHREEQMYHSHTVEENRYNKNRKLALLLWLVSSVILTIIVFVGISLKSASGVLVSIVSILTLGGVSVFTLKSISCKSPRKDGMTCENLDDDADDIDTANDKIQFPDWLNPLEKQNYETVTQVLRSAGFTNIECINLHDLKWSNWENDTDQVDRIKFIKVNGKTIRRAGHAYLAEDKISIYYHYWG